MTAAIAREATPLLQTRGLTKAFGGVHAVANVDFILKPGELRCLIGPNGAGKSTLFSLLSGLHRPDSGSIHFKGEDVTRLPPYQRVRKGICHKFQSTRIYRGMTVGQNLMIGAKLCLSAGRHHQHLEWALSTLQLEGVDEVVAGLLPYSHQQWLEICLALATAPDLLLLDEPTAGMTSEEAALTAGFIRELNAKGLAVLVVEHDMSFVRQLGNGVTVLHYGRIFSEGTLDEIEGNQEVRRIYLGDE